MPYIKQEDRKILDPRIENVFGSLMRTATFENNDQLCGELNYIIFRLAKMLCDQEMWGGERRYARMNAIIGAIESAKAEFQRRIIAPYENEKMDENGDIE